MTETAQAAASASARRPAKVWDIVLSIILMVVGGIGWLIGVGLSLVATTFTAGDCIDPSCDPANSELLNLTSIIAPSVLALGILIAIVRLALRRVAWPFALAAWVLSAATQAFGVLTWR